MTIISPFLDHFDENYWSILDFLFLTTLGCQKYDDNGRPYHVYTLTSYQCLNFILDRGARFGRPSAMRCRSVLIVCQTLLITPFDKRLISLTNIHTPRLIRKTLDEVYQIPTLIKLSSSIFNTSINRKSSRCTHCMSNCTYHSC